MRETLEIDDRRNGSVFFEIKNNESSNPECNESFSPNHFKAAFVELIKVVVNNYHRIKEKIQNNSDKSCCTAIILTIGWLKKTIRGKIQKKNVAKVAFMDFQKLVEECPNEISLDELLEEGCTHIMATVDGSGKIDEIDLFKDIGDGDNEVDRMLGSEGMVVVTA